MRVLSQMKFIPFSPILQLGLPLLKVLLIPQYWVLLLPLLSILKFSHCIFSISIMRGLINVVILKLQNIY